MADNFWQALAITHAMVDGGDLDGLAPNLDPVYPDRVGFRGHRVYRKLTNGGLFIPPGDEIGQFVLLNGFYINTGSAALAGLTFTVEIVPLSKAAGGGLAVGGGDPGPSHLWIEQAVAGSAGVARGPHDAGLILPPHHGVRVITAGVGAGERVSATVVFEKYRDAVASIAL